MGCAGVLLRARKFEHSGESSKRGGGLIIREAPSCVEITAGKANGWGGSDVARRTCCAHPLSIGRYIFPNYFPNSSYQNESR